MFSDKSSMKLYLSNLMSIACKRLTKGQQISVIVGNESSDPDSVVGNLFASILLSARINANAKNLDITMANIRHMSPETSTYDQMVEKISEDFEPCVPLLNSNQIQKILYKSEIAYLDETFGLSIEEIKSVDWLYSISKIAPTSVSQSNTNQKHLVSLYLFDHNSPSSLLLPVLSQNGLVRITNVIDHHVDSNSPHLDKDVLKIIEKSCSCVSTLIGSIDQKNPVWRIVKENFHELAMAAASVVPFDASLFLDHEKDRRWFQYDLDRLAFIEKLLDENGKNQSATIHAKNMMASQYSDTQFKRSLDDLLAADRKVYEMDGVRIEASTMPNTARNYYERFGVDSLYSRACEKVEKGGFDHVMYMFVYIAEEKAENKRDIVVYTRDGSIVDRLVKELTSMKFQVEEVVPEFTIIPQGGIEQNNNTIIGAMINSRNCDVSRKVTEAALRNILVQPQTK